MNASATSTAKGAATPSRGEKKEEKLGKPRKGLLRPGPASVDPGGVTVISSSVLLLVLYSLSCPSSILLFVLYSRARPLL